VVGGWVASVFTAFNTWLCLLRKKWSKWFSFRILEVSGALVQYQLSITALLKGMQQMQPLQLGQLAILNNACGKAC
jgi:hypothetical protein